MQDAAHTADQHDLPSSGVDMMLLSQLEDGGWSSSATTTAPVSPQPPGEQRLQDEGGATDGLREISLAALQVESYSRQLESGQQGRTSGSMAAEGGAQATGTDGIQAQQEEEEHHFVGFADTLLRPEAHTDYTPVNSQPLAEPPLLLTLLFSDYAMIEHGRMEEVYASRRKHYRPELLPCGPTAGLFSLTDIVKYLLGVDFDQKILDTYDFNLSARGQVELLQDTPPFVLPPAGAHSHLGMLSIATAAALQLDLTKVANRLGTTRAYISHDMMGGTVWQIDLRVDGKAKFEPLAYIPPPIAPSHVVQHASTSSPRAPSPELVVPHNRPHPSSAKALKRDRSSSPEVLGRGFSPKRKLSDSTSPAGRRDRLQAARVMQKKTGAETSSSASGLSSGEQTDDDADMIGNTPEPPLSAMSSMSPSNMSKASIEEQFARRTAASSAPMRAVTRPIEGNFARRTGTFSGPTMAATTPVPSNSPERAPVRVTAPSPRTTSSPAPSTTPYPPPVSGQSKGRPRPLPPRCSRPPKLAVPMLKLADFPQEWVLNDIEQEEVEEFIKACVSRYTGKLPVGSISGGKEFFQRMDAIYALGEAVQWKTRFGLQFGPSRIADVLGWHPAKWEHKLELYNRTSDCLKQGTNERVRNIVADRGRGYTLQELRDALAGRFPTNLSADGAREKEAKEREREREKERERLKQRALKASGSGSAS